MKRDLLAREGLELALQILHVAGIARDIQQLLDDRKKEVEGPDPRQRVAPPKGAPCHGDYHGALSHAEGNTSAEEGLGALAVAPRGDPRRPRKPAVAVQKGLHRSDAPPNQKTRTPWGSRLLIRKTTTPLRRQMAQRGGWCRDRGLRP